MATTAEPELLAARVESVLAIPFHRFLGIRLADPSDPAAGLTFTAGPSALNNADVLHGGIATALLDVAAYLAVLPALGREVNAVTHDVAASLLRPVAAGAEVHVAGTVVRHGRALVFLRAEARVGDAVVATGQVTKSIVRVAP